jgi:hypothetical protein
MPTEISIFVDSGEDPATFVKSMEIILGVQMHSIPDRGTIRYSYRDGVKKWINLRIHTFFDDYDLKGEKLAYSNYSYQIEIGLYNMLINDLYEAEINDFANDVFEKIKRSGQYSILLVRNLEQKLDEFSPY